MKYAAMLKVLEMAYRVMLRDLLVKAVDDPDEEWDDAVLRIADGLFNYEE